MASRQGASPQGRAVLESRATIIVKGIVQEVGYRPKVRMLALENDLVGTAENLKDGSVKIVCEGAKSDIEKFARAINLKARPIRVKEIALTHEKPSGKFPAFKIKRGLFDLVSGIPKKADAVALHIQDLHGEMKKLRGDTNRNFNKINGNFNKLDKNLQEFRGDTNRNLAEFRADMNGNFGSMDKKYGTISKDVRAIARKVVGSSAKFSASRQQAGT